MEREELPCQTIFLLACLRFSTVFEYSRYSVKIPQHTEDRRCLTRGRQDWWQEVENKRKVDIRILL